jgi:hypothetical protein
MSYACRVGSLVVLATDVLGCHRVASATPGDAPIKAVVSSNFNGSKAGDQRVVAGIRLISMGDNSMSIRIVVAAFLASLASVVVAQEKDTGATLVVKYGDGKADGKKSIAGAGEMIEFTIPNETQRLAGIRVHCARYGYPQAPDEDVEISLVSQEETDVLHTELVPYSKFKRGDSRWTTIKFKEPVEVPPTFWLILDFNAERTKGVYISYDTSTGGKHSRTGLPGGESKAVRFGGDWMVQAMLTKPTSGP